MGKLTISMAIFNSYVNVYQRVPIPENMVSPLVESDPFFDIEV
jgi:hypothetical protein